MVLIDVFSDELIADQRCEVGISHGCKLSVWNVLLVVYLLLFVLVKGAWVSLLHLFADGCLPLHVHHVMVLLSHHDFVLQGSLVSCVLVELFLLLLNSLFSTLLDQGLLLLLLETLLFLYSLDHLLVVLQGDVV